MKTASKSRNHSLHRTASRVAGPFALATSAGRAAFVAAWHSLTGQTPRLLRFRALTGRSIDDAALVNWLTFHRIPTGKRVRPLPCRIIAEPGWPHVCSIAQLIDEPMP